jgi:hypothetical protein
MIQAVTHPGRTKPFLKMAEEAVKNTLSQSTLVPISLLTYFVGMTVTVVVSFTSLRKDVDHTIDAVLSQSARLQKMEQEAVKKDELMLRLENIQKELENIKDRIKK